MRHACLLVCSGWRFHNFSGFFGLLEIPIWMTTGGSIKDAQRVHGDIGPVSALHWESRGYDWFSGI